MCKCKVKDLDEICSAECRIKNKRSIELVCGDKNYIKLNEENKTEILSDAMIEDNFLNGVSLTSKTACESEDGTVKPVFLTEITTSGFMGLYEPKIDTILEPIKNSRRRKRSVTELNGITNPVTCIDLGTTLIFSVGKDIGYPVYNPDSLYNTNKNFDNTAFLDMAELIEQSTVERPYFSYTFNQPGTFSNSVSMSVRCFCVSARILPTSAPTLFLLSLSSSSSSFLF